MKNAKTAIVYLLVCLAISSLSFLSSCGDSELSKGEAKEIIEKYISKCYGLAVPKEIIFTSPQDNRYRHVKFARDLELVETTQTSGAPLASAPDKFSVTLTEKGNAKHYFEDIYKNTCFLVSENKIDEIVEIKKDNDKSKQFTVLFSYTQRYNDLGKEIASNIEQLDLSWLEDNLKLRGRVTLIYDTFLKCYVIQSMMWSEWEKENWRPAIFVINDKKDSVLYYSYGRSEHGTSAEQAPMVPNLNYQERLRQVERQNAERESRRQEQLGEIQRRNDAMQQERQKEIERRNREIDRANLQRDLRQLEQQAEMERRNSEQALRRQEQLREIERRNAERELNKKFMR